MTTCTLERAGAEGAAAQAYRDLGERIERAHRLYLDHLFRMPAQLDILLDEIHETHVLLHELGKGLATSAEKVTVEHTPAFRRAMGICDREGGDD